MDVAKGVSMNGDLTKIYDEVVSNGNRLTTLETQQGTQHQENKKNYEELHKTIANVIKLKTQVFFQWFFIGAVFIGIITILLKGM